VQSASEEQLVLQVPVPHTYGAQLDVLGLAQLPLPEQNGALVSVDPVHEGLPHVTLDDACSQAPDWQAPVLPQVPLAGQAPCGSGWPFPTVPQLPVPEMLQV
jgi:hypothetical protein